jgi:PKD repeat protein
MRKILFTLLLLSSLVSNAQVVCIFCYNQNDSISSNVTNLIQNGSFEYGCPPFGNFIPNSTNYNCDLTGWTASGGASMTYAMVWDTTVPASQTPDGANVVYFGNGVFARVCSAQYFDTSCFGDTDCVSTNIQSGYPYNDSSYGGPNGPSIEQTVNNLIVGNTYILEFWAGGEGQASGWMDRGLFGVDVGFGYIFLRNKPTSPGYIGTRFIIEFNATSTSHTVKFTNWGHICGTCTELTLDDVRLYPLADLSPVVPPCAGATITAMFTADNHICPGTCTEFTNLSTNATSYIWSFPGANPNVSTDPNPTNICYNSPGNYNVQLIAANATSADTLLLPNYITVYPAPPPQGIIQNGDTLFANPVSVSYQWYYSGNIIPGATNYFYVAPQSGNYSVVASDQNGCEVEAVINNVVAGLTPTLSTGEGVTTYPNPVTDKLYVNSYKPAGTAVEVSIYNVVGEKIYSAPYQNEMTIDCKFFPSGIYFLEMSSLEKCIRTNFVKQ